MSGQAVRILREAQRLHQKGQIQQASRLYQKALEIEPTNPEARIFYALALQQSGRNAEAHDESQRAIRTQTKHSTLVLNTFGVIQKNLGKLEDAEWAYEQALAQDPTRTAIKANLAALYLLRGKLDQSEKLHRDLISETEEVAPRLNLARICILRERYEEVQEIIRDAEDRDPSHVDILLLKARLEAIWKNDELAYQYCLEGLRREPNHRELFLQLQALDHSVINSEDIETLASLVLSTKSTNTQIISILVDLCRRHWAWKSLGLLEQILDLNLLQGSYHSSSFSDLFTLLGADISQESHLVSATGCWKQLYGSVIVDDSFQPRVKPLDDRNLRVGLLSSDLRDHAIGRLIVGLIESLPSHEIEWIGYSNSLDDSSPIRKRIRDKLARFVNIVKLNDKELASKIYADQIDILIDLNQATAETRVGVMAYRPAPIQIQWLGMPGSMGAECIDYIIVDPWVVDESNVKGFSESFLMLPRSYQPNDHKRPSLNLSPSRDEAGLPEDKIILGCFNQYYKFSPETLKLWSQIAQQVPQAVFWLLEPTTLELRRSILSQFHSYEISQDRIYFAPSLPNDQHLSRLRWMDLVLDTWPYNAHTTCSDALRVGVPVLTLPGRTFASRVASGILHTAGMDYWVASSPLEYVDKAIAFASQKREQIDEQKLAVFEKYWSSPMVDNRTFGLQLQALLFGVYKRLLTGAQPSSLRLSSDLTISELSFQDIRSQAIPAVSSGDLLNANSAHTPSRLSNESYSQGSSTQQSWLDSLANTGRNSRLHNLCLFQKYILDNISLPLVVDIGASNIDAPIGYEELADAGLVNVLGFEPDPDSFASLTPAANRHYLPLAVGDGKPHSLHRCVAPGMNSLLKLDQEWCSLFPGFNNWGLVNQVIENLPTKRLDDIPEAANTRFLKIDVQGFEFRILQGAIETLSQVSILQFESSPTPIYKGEQSLFEIGLWLSSHGFVLHTFSNINKRAFKPYASEDDPFLSMRHIFQVDAVFIPNPLSWGDDSDDRLLSLAFLAHAIYKSSDLSMMALQELDRRDNGHRVELFNQYLTRASVYA